MESCGGVGKIIVEENARFWDKLYLKQPVRLDYLWAGLCLLGAVGAQIPRTDHHLPKHPNLSSQNSRGPLAAGATAPLSGTSLERPGGPQ